MSRIESVVARQVLDSRGNPTVEAEVTLRSGARRAGDRALGRLHGRPGGRGAPRRRGRLGRQGRPRRRRLRQRGDLREALCGLEARRPALRRPALCDLDGTPDKSRLGANALLAVSLAVARAAAEDAGLAAVPVPRGRQRAPAARCRLLNVINGGAHATNSIDFQEFMLVPLGAADVLRSAALGRGDLPRAAAPLLADKGLSTGVGDEGGFAPDLPDNETALTVLLEAIERAGYTPGDQVAIALDPATHGVLARRRLRAGRARGGRCRASELVDYWATLCGRYPIVSIEDGMAEDDWDGWRALTERLGDSGPARRRRRVRDEPRAAASGHRRGRRQRGAHQAQPDRHASPRRSTRSSLAAAARLRHGHLAPLRGDRGHDRRRPGRRGQRRAAEGRRAGEVRSRRQVQPAAAHRGGARRRRQVRGAPAYAARGAWRG